MSMQQFIQDHLCKIPTDIDHYPRVINTDYSPRTLVLGDSHANTLTMLHIFVTVGTIEISAKTYQNFVDFYYANDLSAMQSWLQQLTVRPFARYCFVGDEHGDRAVNDGFTDKLLRHMAKRGVGFDFVASNHGTEYIKSYERFDRNKPHEVFTYANKACKVLRRGYEFWMFKPGCSQNHFHPVRIFNGQANSQVALDYSLRAGTVSYDELYQFIEEVYKPNLKLVVHYRHERGYEIVVTHAPTGEEEYALAARQFAGREVDTVTTSDIAAINQGFAEVVMGNRVHTLFTPDDEMRDFFDEKPDSLYLNFVWNRNYDGIRRDVPSRIYVHGHDGLEACAGNVVNLDHDNELGKMENKRHHNVGVLKLFIAIGRPLQFQQQPIAIVCPQPVAFGSNSLIFRGNNPERSALRSASVEFVTRPSTPLPEGAVSLRRSKTITAQLNNSFLTQLHQLIDDIENQPNLSEKQRVLVEKYATEFQSILTHGQTQQDIQQNLLQLINTYSSSKQPEILLNASIAFVVIAVMTHVAGLLGAIVAGCTVSGVSVVNYRSNGRLGFFEIPAQENESLLRFDETKKLLH